MNDTDLTAVVDAVSAKIGLAADALAPITGFYCPNGYGECEDANGCCYPGRCYAAKAASPTLTLLESVLR